MSYKTAIISFVFIVALITNLYSQNLKRRVLFIGNSYTSVNNLPQLTADLALSAGDTLIVDSYSPGGYTLANHFNDSLCVDKIKSGGWDCVVLQEQSQIPTFDTYSWVLAGELCKLIREYNPCAHKMFYMTWGRKNGDASNCAALPPVCTYLGMDSLLHETYMFMASLFHTEVSPVGAVWRDIRLNNPAIELYQSDESHPSVAGSYAAACSFYSAIFKKDPATITNDYGLSSSDASIIRNAAKLIVYDSLQSWDFSNYQPTANFNYSIGTGNNEIIFNNTSSDADFYLWDFGDNTNSSDTNPTHIFPTNGTFTITLTASTCDLSHTYTSTFQQTINFCPHNPTIFPDSLIVCPGMIDTLWTQSYDSYQWFDSNGNMISNATNQFILTSGNETFSVLANENGCAEKSPPVYAGSYFSGLVIYHIDTLGTLIKPDTACIGDTMKLVLASNKPGNPDNIIEWRNNGIIIPFANDDTLMITSSGNYELSQYYSQCGAIPFYVSPVFNYTFINCNAGINESDVYSTLKIFPNPSEGIINFQINNSLIGESYLITDLLGRTIVQNKLIKELNIIDLRKIKSGIYFLKILNLNLPSYKIIKN